jgi:hypothetical protein
VDLLGFSFLKNIIMRFKVNQKVKIINQNSILTVSDCFYHDKMNYIHVKERSFAIPENQLKPINN